MGMRCSDTAVIYFEDVRVPAKNIIGVEGYGFTYQMLQFQQERLACAALSLMPLERCIADTIGKMILILRRWIFKKFIESIHSLDFSNCTSLYNHHHHLFILLWLTARSSSKCGQ